MLRNPRGRHEPALAARAAARRRRSPRPGRRLSGGERRRRARANALRRRSRSTPSSRPWPSCRSASATSPPKRPCAPTTRRGEARASSTLAERFQRLTRELFGRAKVFASDEFYLVAGLQPPTSESFESLDEAENGVGLVAAFVESFAERTPMAKLGSGFFQSVDGAPALGYRAPRDASSSAT